MKSRAASLAAAVAILSLCTSTASLAAPGAAKQRNAPVFERALKGQGPTIVGPGVVTPEDVVMYSGDTTGAPTWDRPFADCTGLSALGPVTFQVQPFTVSANGNYDVTGVQPGWDGFLFVYQNAFDPTAPNTNCVIGNDDGGGGIGTSDILGVPLTTGVQYFVITTAFELGEEGTYDNTLSGNGTIVLGGGGPAVVITKSTPGVALTGEFDYDFTVTNNGPGADTGIVVTDTLPAAVTYVSDNCGGGAVGQTWTWNVGGLAEGASATCTLVVLSSLGGTCAEVENSASVTSDGGANNSSTVTNASEAVQDPGFEDGSPSTFWTEASTNFGTPLCTEAGCGVGGGTGAHSGDWWTWFGGTLLAEEGSMSQSVTMPAGGSATLTFFLEAPTCEAGSGADDFMEITVDGTQVFLVNATSSLCNVVGYTQQSVDLSAYADGAAHTIAFHSITSDQIVNFFVDDVSIADTLCVPGGGPEPPAEVPALDGVGFLALAGLLALAGFVALRRRTA